MTIQMGREGPKIPTLLPPRFLHGGTWGVSATGLYDQYFWAMLLLLCGPQRAYAFRSRVTGHGGACKEATAPCQHKATAVCHRGFPRWDCYSFGFVAGAAYAERTCLYPYLPHWGSQGRHGARVSCCPFCAYTIQNDPAYLNNIVCAHYDATFRCGSCLSAIASSGQQMKAHIKECSGLAPLPTASQKSAPSGRSPKKSAPDSKHMRSKKKGSHSEKSQPAGQASQDSQASDRRVTRVTGVSQETPAESTRCRTQHKKKKAKVKKEKKSRK